MSFNVLLTIPVKIFPGPISIKSLTFSLDILIILSLHLTEEQICSINNFFILSGLFSGLEVTLETTSKLGFLKANISFALQRKDLGKYLKNWLKKI